MLADSGNRRKDQECQQVHDYDRRSGRGGQEKREGHAKKEAHHRENRGADHHALEGMAETHRGQCRENQQAGDQKCAHHAHAEDGGDGV